MTLISAWELAETLKHRTFGGLADASPFGNHVAFVPDRSSFTSGAKSAGLVAGPNLAFFPRLGPSHGPRLLHLGMDYTSCLMCAI